MTGNRDIVPPFQNGYRASGMLLHVTSLPSRYGNGDFGPSALSWIDRLAEAGQSWWQVLPLNPIGAGHSPYSSISTFAVSGLLISPDWLIEDGLTKTSECMPLPFSKTAVDYDAVIPYKTRLLETAWARFQSGARSDLRPDFERFRDTQSHWLEDFALFLALRRRFEGAQYLQWPTELAEREPVALDRMQHEMADEIGAICFVQFLAARHRDRVKAYAHSKGVRIIGDLPFYVAPDSCDVWSHPEIFQLDKKHHPTFVGGVPPDYFSADGQLWGNPVYDWDALRRTDYDWWVSRLKLLLDHVDVIRLDHFRAFVAAWHIPEGAATAKFGQWKPGPGVDFFHRVQKELGALPFIAEDLGQITSDVYALRDQFSFPGMRVLQFAFDGHADNPHLPENYVENSVVYTGTHDNSTTRGWFDDLPQDQRDGVLRYLKQRNDDTGEAGPSLMELAWSSMAGLAIAPLQDLLNLGKEARMNVPGVPDGNWRWRYTEDMLSDRQFERLRDFTKASNRLRAISTPDISTRNGEKLKENANVSPVAGV